MDVVLEQGDQLVIEIDVVDGANTPLDMSTADIRYVIDGVWDKTEADVAFVIAVDGPGSYSRVRLTVPVDFAPGRYEHECKVQVGTIGPATILDGVVLVEASLIGSDV